MLRLKVNLLCSGNIPEVLLTSSQLTNRYIYKKKKIKLAGSLPGSAWLPKAAGLSLRPLGGCIWDCHHCRSRCLAVIKFYPTILFQRPSVSKMDWLGRCGQPAVPHWWTERNWSIYLPLSRKDSSQDNPKAYGVS
ncbi:hypothetical protein KIL84_020342 [Mauremys mutica]|uniref:Uncharacterized protein n=1 Tax=Mauremys mutica TaxID=74926 RepID=A0A9D3XWL8_9SAUR|nr:hypothetical protein KIL84_020342 [Mauremys mutica]